MNLDLDAVAYISLVATLLGLVLQFKDVFPEHREARKAILLVVFGIFLGSIVSALRGVKVDFGPTLNSSDIVKVAFTSLVVILAVIGAFTSESQRRMELLLAALICSGVVVLLLAGTAMVSSQDDLDKRHRQRISLDELLMLADASISKENYDRGLMFLQEAKGRISSVDERRKYLEQRETEVRAMQMRSKR